MSHDQIKDYKCPNCGGEMEQGYVAGHLTPLRWCLKEKTKTIFSGKRLQKKLDIWNAPTIAAVRCDQCKLGLFTYDN